MKLVPLATTIPFLLLCSCGALMEATFEGGSDQQIREDTANLQSGQPLQHFKSERQLRAAREDRFIREIQNN